MNFNPLHHPVIFSQLPHDTFDPLAWGEHLSFAMFLINSLQPAVMVELGTAPGTLHQVAQNLATSTQCHAIEAGQKSEALLAQFADGSIDLLSLDSLPAAFHSEAWLPKIRSGGIVLVHGTNTNKAWAELKLQYPHFEFAHGQGLGVLAVGEAIPPELKEFFSASEAEAESIRSFFSTLGSHNYQQHLNRQQQAYQTQRELYHARRESDFTEAAAKLKQQRASNEEGWRVVQTQLDMIVNSRGWRLLLLLWRLSRNLAPQNTVRRRLLLLATIAVQRVATSTGTITRKFIRLDEYAEWIAQNEPRKGQLQQQSDEAEQFIYRPMISIITPVYNTPPRLLEEMIRSVVEQTYGNWQLCLADGNSSTEMTKAILRKWVEKDRRIKVTYLEQNLGISGNSNAALQMAEGEFIALLDHDDLIAPFALYEIVKLLNEQPETDFIYSDRDMVSEDGARRFSPFFKPGWSPEIMLAANYLCHLCVIRKRVADDVGGFNAAMDGAQDWDFFLRVMERTNRMAHIPKVLYHWRQWSNSSASGISAKPYAIAAQKRAVREHLQRRGLEAETDIYPGGFVRATWPVSGAAKVSIIVLTGDDVTQATINLEKLLRLTSYRNFELLLVRSNEQASVPTGYLQETALRIAIQPVIYQATQSFSAACNLAARRATGELLLFLNACTEVIREGWLEEMVRWAEMPDVGVVGAKLVDADGIVRHAGVALGMNDLVSYPLSGLPENSFGIFGSTEWYRNWLAIAGDCLMVRKSLFEQIGGFDENAAHPDLALCLKANAAGQRAVYTPHAKLGHSGPLRHHFTNNARTPGVWLTRANESVDPFFNPNLSIETPIPQLKIGIVTAPDHG